MMGIQEAQLEGVGSGLAPLSRDWFVLNASDGPTGHRSSDVPQTGFTLPQEPLKT